jgi:hypothetical protein
MDLKLKSLQKQLDLCNEKMQVLDYVYYKYDNYLDNNIKEYISLKHTMLELSINRLINEVDEVYKELEINILERIDIIQRDIDNLRKKEIKKRKLINGMLSYVLMSILINNKDLFFKDNNDLQSEIDKYNNELLQIIE